MATLEDIYDAVIAIVRDPGLVEADVYDLIDVGRRYVAGKVLLENLESSGTVDSVEDEFEVAIPVSWNYMRNLSSASVEDAGEIQIVGSIEHLRRHYPTFDTDMNTGEIEFITLSNGNIIYYPIPDAATTITCNFHTKVDETLLSPSELPEDLHEAVLQNWCLWKLFDSIEDGVEGQKINTLWHQKQFNDALIELEDRITTGQSRFLPDRTTTWI